MGRSARVAALGFTLIVAFASACRSQPSRGDAGRGAPIASATPRPASDVAPVITASAVSVPTGYRLVQAAAGGRAHAWSFAVPAAWLDTIVSSKDVTTAAEKVLPGTDVSGFHPVAASRDATPTVDFTTNVNLGVESFEGDGRAYGEANVAQLGRVATLRHQAPTQIGSLSALDAEASWRMPNVAPYRTLQRFTAARGVGYTLSCSGSEHAFERVRATCQRILDSFRVEP